MDARSTRVSRGVGGRLAGRLLREMQVLLDGGGNMDAHQKKNEAAPEALSAGTSGMKLGLGTGSTATEFVKLLGEALAAGRLRDIRCTSTSEQTAKLAASVGITIEELAAVSPLDLAIDGADEIDAGLRLIKGRGGAL